MADISQILNTLNTSPSIGLLRLRNREVIIEFLVRTFVNKQNSISSENIHYQLADFLDRKGIEIDEESEINFFENDQGTPTNVSAKLTLAEEDQ
jgi:hypothetical protein